MEQLGYSCDIMLLNNTEEILRVLHHYQALVINSRFVLNSEHIRQMKGVRFIARVGAGMENVDTKYLEERGILWFNSPEGNRQAVGEHSTGMLLSMLNKINIADKSVKSGLWQREVHRGTELSGKTLAIIGYGNMGSAFAKCLHGFDVKVIAYDKYKKDYSDSFVTESSLENVFNEADIVSMHVPLTNETEYMVDYEFLSKFRKSIYFINTSRGKVVNTKDLVSHLINKKLLGVALDVNEYESLSFENLTPETYPEPLKYLINSEHVILTPHIAGWTFEADFKHARVLAQKIKNSLAEL